MGRAFLASFAFILSPLVIADTVISAQVSLAQGQMLSRISAAGDAHAKRLGLESAYVSYCYGELALKTGAYPAMASSLSVSTTTISGTQKRSML